MNTSPPTPGASRARVEVVDTHVVLDLTATGILGLLAAAVAVGGDGVRHAWDRLVRSRGADHVAARDLAAAEFVRGALRIPMEPVAAEVLSVALADAALDVEARVRAEDRAASLAEDRAAQARGDLADLDPRVEP